MSTLPHGLPHQTREKSLCLVPFQVGIQYFSRFTSENKKTATGVTVLNNLV